MLIDSAAQYSNSGHVHCLAVRRGRSHCQPVMGQTLAATEHTLNTFINTCNDLEQIDRVLLLHGGLTAEDRIALVEKYRFLDFVDATSIDRPSKTSPGSGKRSVADSGCTTWVEAGSSSHPNADQQTAPSWVPSLRVFQVTISFNDAQGLTGTCASERDARRTPSGAGTWSPTPVAAGPALYDVLRLDQVGGFGRHRQ